MRNPVGIKIDDYPIGKRTDLSLPVYYAAAASKIEMPVIITRGAHPGPTLGVTAAVHGNELNGIRIIHALLKDLDLSSLKGALLCVPVVNIPGFNLGQRYFIDDVDLNSAFPGKKDGKPSQQYARSIATQILPGIDYLIDIHTASEGRLNTMYVRVDPASEQAVEMAMNINPQIVLHAKGGDQTWRAAASRKGIPSITVEAGNPSVIQGRMVFEGEIGIRNVMTTLGMLEGHITVSRRAIVCQKSSWIRTTHGGILSIKFKLGEILEKKQVIAEVYDLFGRLIHTYRAPHRGVVIGMAAYPIAVPGTRFCHLGRIMEDEGSR